MVWIKICGFRDVESAVSAAELGVDAIGLNFVSRSRRHVSVETGCSIAKALRGRVELVGVVEDIDWDRADELRGLVGLDAVQVHLTDWFRPLPRTPDWGYLAVGITRQEDVAQLHDLTGSRLLMDAAAGGKSGGTGTTFDWSWATAIAQTRRIIIAGGLAPSNVDEAIRSVHPYGVDVASGVEVRGCPGLKEANLMRDFVTAVRQAGN